MINIANAQFWVHDHDVCVSTPQARVGGASRHHDRGVELPLARRGPARAGRDRPGADEDPWPPMLDEATSAQLAELVAKGVGGTLFLETDDCQASYDELSARGVEFNDPPTEQPYGIDTSFRDPSGNNVAHPDHGVLAGPGSVTR